MWRKLQTAGAWIEVHANTAMVEHGVRGRSGVGPQLMPSADVAEVDISMQHPPSFRTPPQTNATTVLLM